MLLLTMLKILRGPLVNPFHRETHLGNKLHAFFRNSIMMDENEAQIR